MSEKFVYTPILKWKRGERYAVDNLEENIKKKIRPLFTAMDNAEPDTYAINIAQKWGKNSPFFFDFHPTFFERNDYEFEIFFEELLEEAEANEIKPIPILNSDLTEPLIKLINQHSQKINNGVGIRINVSNFDNFDSLINKIVQKLNFPKSEIDLIIDLKRLDEIPEEVLDTLDLVTAQKIEEAQSYDFRNIILAGASFPESLSGLDYFSTSTIPRREFKIWQSIYEKYPKIKFGDYGTDDPKDPDYDHFVIIIPTIRYTREKQWHIIRGEHDKDKPNDFTQFHKLAEMLINKSFYSGSNYSWGDNKIKNIATTQCQSPEPCNHGNPETWVRINTNHHITFVTKQIANFF